MRKILLFLSIFLICACTNTSKNENASSNKEEAKTTEISKETAESNVFPTKEEIQNVNAKLPIQVDDGTMFTKVEYDENKRVQTFYYDFTREVDESMITPDVVATLKNNMVEAFKNGATDLKRIKAGVTYLYVYRSVNKRKLYDIKIDASDFE